MLYLGRGDIISRRPILRGDCMLWNNFVSRALWLFTRRNNITYCLGCAGEIAGVDLAPRNNFLYYYNHGWKDRIGKDLAGWNENMNASDTWELWLKYNRGKMCFDCSGLLCWCLGYEKQHIYSSWDFGNMRPSTTPAAGFAGYALFKEKHVGVDIGYGYMLEIGSYNHTIELNKISERDFISSHAVAGVDYTGADAR